MNSNTKIKYILLLLFAFGTIGSQIKMGDYTDGVASLAGTVGLFFLLTVIVIIAFLKNMYDKYKYNQRFKPEPLLIWIVTLFTTVFLMSFDDGKFFAKKIAECSVQNPTKRMGMLTLYDDGEFYAKIVHHEIVECYNGNYTIGLDTLRLNRSDIVSVTDSTFSEVYFVDRQNCYLISKSTGDSLRIDTDSFCKSVK